MAGDLVNDVIRITKISHTPLPTTFRQQKGPLQSGPFQYLVTAVLHLFNLQLLPYR